MCKLITVSNPLWEKFKKMSNKQKNVFVGSLTSVSHATGGKRPLLTK